MDITMSSKKRYTNSFMNGETVNYVLSFSFSFLFPSIPIVSSE